ncbi:VCBS repeat-containing protein, partial [Streptomyces sp. NRRL B-24572]|uniref:FG-GAP repeat domain-containing protein n=1 Tax=Streptomyces sp. NRRL B-24572 TaxID=1962156 RepID=UPI000A35F416
MQHRSSARRLAAAVTAVLAVTAGTLAAGPAALAAPSGALTAVSGATATTAAAPVPYPAADDAIVSGAGTTGFLTFTTGTTERELRWTRYADGTSTVLTVPEGGGFDPTGSDVVVTGDSTDPRQMRSVTLTDMGAPDAAPVHIDLGALSATYVKVVGPDSVLAAAPGPNNTQKLLLVTDENGTTHSREITGLPVDALHFFTNAPAVGGQAVVAYVTGPEGARENGRAVIDLATGAVVETYAAGGYEYLYSGLALSVTHVAWAEARPEGTGIVTVDRKTGARRWVPLHIADGYVLGLVGNWLVYAVPSKLTENGTFPDTRVRALDLTSGDAADITDYATSAQAASDGTLLVRGGTVAEGEGLYKVSPVAGAQPSVEKVATTNQPTALTYLGSQVPAVVDLDRDREVELKWRMSRLNADVSLKLTHLRTGQTFTRELKLHRDFPSQYTFDDITFGLTWQGVLDDLSKDGKSAFNGDYAWSFRAVPQNGIGPEVKQAGTFKVVRSVKPHDYSDNGSPDLFARDAGGSLWRADTTYNSYTRRLMPTYQRASVGSGWNAYDRIESVGNVAGTGVADTIARDTTGVLWLYQGTGDEKRPFATRTKIGSGWGGYKELAGGSDLNGDGRPDLVATDASGVLWLYKGTGSATAPFAARVKVGGGWGGYNQLTAVGNLAGGPAGDLLARDTAGVLWLYLG